MDTDNIGYEARGAAASMRDAARDSTPAADSRANGHTDHTAADAARTLRAPRTLADTGLPATFVAALVLKSTHVHGKSCFADLSERHRLPISVLDDVLAHLVRERLAEISHRGASDVDVHLRLTDAGRAAAHDELARCAYFGPAPVTLESYIDSIANHSVRSLRIVRNDVQAAFHNIAIDPTVLDAAAASLNAGRPLLLYGPAGSGKTFLAERLGRLLRGDVPVPYAIYAGGEIVQLYDPLVHEDAAGEAPAQPGDRRWRLCRRPVVISGGELTLDMLDLRRDASTGFYQAPPHMKANMGIYIVDDLGRQRIEPRDLLNRWLMPLDRNFDLFTLQNGSRFSVPFDVWPVFSSNLEPAELEDEAFLRRLGSKIYVGPLAIDDYRAVFESCCAALGVEAPEDAFAYLVHRLHIPSGKPFLACYPNDLLRLVAAAAYYRGEPKVATQAALRDAWCSYFGVLPDHDGIHPSDEERAARKLASG
ncbi:ATP-binding protein [Paraburkholderia kururiensis]|uniref:ATP-binding protein n=1 Tax=Paraburkholderia kururiensis TaxID=984307 RepID=UPI00034D03D9|nr:ATP-binding protein [Paraburkholderia kururiensis]